MQSCIEALKIGEGNEICYTIDKVNWPVKILDKLDDREEMDLFNMELSMVNGLGHYVFQTGDCEDGKVLSQPIIENLRFEVLDGTHERLRFKRPEHT